jgi:hypothetical protein
MSTDALDISVVVVAAAAAAAAAVAAVVSPYRESSNHRFLDAAMGCLEKRCMAAIR